MLLHEAFLRAEAKYKEGHKAEEAAANLNVLANVPTLVSTSCAAVLMLWLVDMPSDGQQDTGLLVRPDGWKALERMDGADLEIGCEMSWAPGRGLSRPRILT